MVEANGRVVVMDTPTFTGKTTVLTEFIAEVVERESTEKAKPSRIAYVTHNNENLVEMVQQLSELRSSKIVPLVLTSKAMYERLDDSDMVPKQFEEWSSRTVIDKIATEPRLGEEDRKFMKEYMAKHKEHSRRPFQEGHALRLVMKYHKPHLVLDTIRDQTTILIVDGANQFTKAQIFSLICKFPKLEQVIISGDFAQLDCYKKTIPMEIWQRCVTSLEMILLSLY
ncbi:hypothetical protein AAVH_10435 [Aphelenchoides avenae]|nr:hypothetical protein AAVH_10435 [Aphelenchus avenae]